MKTLFYITVLILGVLTFGGTEANAKKVEGYIITNDNDTLQGYLNIYNSTLTKWTISLSPKVFNAEMAFIEASFKQDRYGSYKIYKPEDLKEYGFTYKGIQYVFKTFIVKSNTFVLNERAKPHFLLLVNNDKGREMYKHQMHRYDAGKRELTPFYVFYVLGKDGELIKVD